MPIQTHPTSHALLFLISLLLLKPATGQQTPSTPTPESPPPYNFSPSMATAIIILIILFFSIGFISVYIRHFMLCLGFVPGRGLDGGIEAWRRERNPRGLDPKIVDTFPTFIYSDVKMHRIGKSSLECAICLNEFTDHEILRMLPPCSHVFHPNCVGPWLASHVTCPVCRANLENGSNRCLSFDYLTQQFEQLSDEDEVVQPSDHHQQDNRDMIVHVGASPRDTELIKSPMVHEIKCVDGRIGILPRSHSTGHSLAEDCERYTLRLPKDVRNKLVNINLSGLPAAIVSPPIGYRTRSTGGTDTGSVKPDHWRFSVSPPFISRSTSVHSQKSCGDIENNSSNNANPGGIVIGSRNLFKSIKSPFNRVTRTDDIGERSTNRLWVNRTNQDVELEAQWHHKQ